MASGISDKSLNTLLRDSQVIAILCHQWGDTGKGKFSDYFASNWADVIARGTGGNNAGHTVVQGGRQRIFRSLPSGIVYDQEGKINIIGPGMVLDLEMLCQELEMLRREGLSWNHLMISRDAHLIMPYHVARDRAVNQSQCGGGIGSTGKGIGPCYADKIARRGIRVGDLFDRDTLAGQIKRALAFYPEVSLGPEEILTRLQPLAETVRPLVRDTVAEIHRLYREGQKILLEGAQGLLLSVEHGTYPYVTSSDSSLNGTAGGVGLPASAVDLPLGVVKFPFMTRVGGGPFPTELGAARSEEHCRDEAVTVKEELERFGIPHRTENGRPVYDHGQEKIQQLMNTKDPFQQGIGLRLAAGEYGAVTGRPRRVGWTDAVAARYAAMINGTSHIILTKPDACAGLDRFRVCYGYEIEGTVRTDFPRDAGTLRKVHPSYRDYGGYGDIGAIRDDRDLPETLRRAVIDFEAFTCCSAAIISVGPEAEQTIIKKTEN
jgi:adenylosuccinate synthase